MPPATTVTPKRVATDVRGATANVSFTASWSDMAHHAQPPSFPQAQMHMALLVLTQLFTIQSWVSPLRTTVRVKFLVRKVLPFKPNPPAWQAVTAWLTEHRSLTCSVHLSEQAPALGMEWDPCTSLQLLGCLGSYENKSHKVRAT